MHFRERNVCTFECKSCHLLQKLSNKEKEYIRGGPGGSQGDVGVENSFGCGNVRDNREILEFKGMSILETLLLGSGTTTHSFLDQSASSVKEANQL